MSRFDRPRLERCNAVWHVQPEKDGVKGVCYDIAFKPGMLSCVLPGKYCCLHGVCSCADGSELVTGIGSRVLVYETTAGDLLHSLRGHKVQKSCSFPLSQVTCQLDCSAIVLPRAGCCVLCCIFT